MTRIPLVILTSLALTQSAAGQVSPGPLTLAQAIALGRERGINAALARYNVQVADARAGQRRGRAPRRLESDARAKPRRLERRAAGRLPLRGR